MGDEHKTKEQLIDELTELCQRIAELEATDTERVKSAKEKPSGRSTHPWDEITFFAEAVKCAAEKRVSEAPVLLRYLYNWAEKRFHIDWGAGKKIGSFMPSLVEDGGPPHLFLAKTNGTVTIPFNQLRRELSGGDFETLAELVGECRRRLEELGIVLRPEDLQPSSEPWFWVTDLDEENAWAEFVKIIEWYAGSYHKWKHPPQELGYESPADDTSEIQEKCDLPKLLVQCQEDTARLLGQGAANRLARWEQYKDDQARLIEFIQRMLRGPGRYNGWELDQNGGLSLERIVIEHCPGLFTEADILQARETLQLEISL